jgi:hypothetical protein
VGATYQVRPLLPMAVRHRSFSLEDFISAWPKLQNSMVWATSDTTYRDYGVTVFAFMRHSD